MGGACCDAVFGSAVVAVVCALMMDAKMMMSETRCADRTALRMDKRPPGGRKDIVNREEAAQRALAFSHPAGKRVAGASAFAEEPPGGVANVASRVTRRR